MKVSVSPASSKVVNFAPINKNVAAANFVYRRYNVKTPSLQWYIRHNVNSDRIQVTLRDSDNQEFYALITIIDKNAFQIDLTEAITGFVDVIFYIGPIEVFDI